MISKETSTHLLARLMGLSYYPRDNRAAEDDLVLALQQARQNVRCCERCGAFTTVDANPCALCTDASRDDALLL